MAKKKEEVKNEVETEVVVEETVKKEKVDAKFIFPVVNSTGQIVRTYTVEIHGEDAGKLANQFATKIKGEVL